MLFQRDHIHLSLWYTAQREKLLIKQISMGFNALKKKQ